MLQHRERSQRSRRGAGRKSKSPSRNRDNLVCQGPEMPKHTPYSGKDKVIGEFGRNKWMEGASWEMMFTGLNVKS